MIFYNTETKEYPRYQGDLELLGWNAGEPLPENWVQVEDTMPVFDISTQAITEELPELVDGKYVRKYQVRDLSPEELAANNQEVALEDLPYA